MLLQRPLPADPSFEQLQERFICHFQDIFQNDLAEKTVVIIPSLTLDPEILKTVTGISHYEERMLSMLLLLRMPKTQVIYVTSEPIDSSIIDYYLHLLPGVTGYHARQRLQFFSCYDASEKPLTQKILERPRLIRRIREAIRFPELAHVAFFNVTELERALALQLDIPVFGCDPRLLHIGTKSGSRSIFKKLGIPLPQGEEDLYSPEALSRALASIKREAPDMQRAVVKINDGFSGDGNAIFSYRGLEAEDPSLELKILEELELRLKRIASTLSFKEYLDKFCRMGGIAEAFIEGDLKESPSVQCRINADGESKVLSTHNQLMAGESDQVFLGCTFPASKAYNREIAEMGLAISRELQTYGVLGRFSVDFMSVWEPQGWKHYAIEINLRKGGTTHPFVLLQFLTEGEFHWEEGEFVMPNGQTRCYFSSDNVTHEAFKGLTPHDLIDIAMCNRLQYDGARQTGVMFHMIGALSQFGKLGMVCIGKTQEEAQAFYQKTIQVLHAEGAGSLSAANAATPPAPSL